jgi:hypothetical protein
LAVNTHRIPIEISHTYEDDQEEQNKKYTPIIFEVAHVPAVPTVHGIWSTPGF